MSDSISMSEIRGASEAESWGVAVKGRGEEGTSDDPPRMAIAF